MGTPKVNVQDILKKLSFLKNNLALLVPILIALVAILTFIPTTLLSGKLRSQIEQQSVQAGRQIDGLIRDVNQAAEAEAMGPYMNAYAQDANAMEDAIRQTTLRELLDYKVFADPNQTSQLVFDPFRQKYLAGVEAMLERLRAGGPPPDTEIFAALDASPTRSLYGRNRRTTSRPSTGGLYGGAGYGQGFNFRRMMMMSETDRKIIEKVLEDKARGIKVYVNPVDLGGYLYWSDWKFEDWDKAIKDSWYWQMAYWILEDVVTTVDEMNKSADNVLHAPVKRVMNVLFTQSRMGRTMIGRGRRRPMAAKDQEAPTYVTGVKNAMTGTPCTGRFSNPDSDYDVMQFEVRVVAQASEVMHFMQELCSAKTHQFRGWYGDQPPQTYKHNQITILESSVTPVDREDFDHGSFEYGPDEVVDVDLICEYLFDVKAYDSIMPKEVKDEISGTEQTK